jgi:hypothetical protein
MDVFRNCAYIILRDPYRRHRRHIRVLPAVANDGKDQLAGFVVQDEL